MDDQQALLLMCVSPVLLLGLLAAVCGPSKVFTAMTAMASEYNRACASDSPTPPSPPALTAVGAVLADTTDSSDDEAGSEKED